MTEKERKQALEHAEKLHQELFDYPVLWRMATSLSELLKDRKALAALKEEI